MNIYEASKRTGVSIANLRKLEKLKILKLDDEKELAPVLRFSLARNAHLPVAHILALIDDPGLIDELGRYSDKARAQMAELGAFEASAAPARVSYEIPDAMKGDKEAAGRIAAWLRDVLPPEGVSHYWIAARMLAPLNEFLRAKCVPRFGLALLTVRDLPEFKEWWRMKGKSVIYFRPSHFSLDL